ncbi:ribose-phosphate pyrophosphokinase 2 [Lepeophtheirus salmonis]|nr:ribose-phosphate pyrophosphokinase 3-like [Lepeophtheirus salmonis]
MNNNNVRNRSTLRIFSGSAHPKLAKDIAKKVGVRVTAMESKKFSNKELRVELNENIRSHNIYIIQTAGRGRNPNDDFMELMLFINACRLASASKITLILPMFPYSQGNKKNGIRVPITCRLMADLLQKAGASHIMILDPRTPQLEGFFGLTVDSLKMEALICDWIRKNIVHWQNCIVVSPDEDSVHQGVSLANTLGVSYTFIHNRNKKPREYTNENGEEIPKILISEVFHDSSKDSEEEGIKNLKINYKYDNESEEDTQSSEEEEELSQSEKGGHSFYQNEDECFISPKVANKTVILLDDMIDSGTAMVFALNQLKKAGAEKIYVFATHAIFSGNAIDRIFAFEEILEAVVVSNSLPQEEEYYSKYPKFHSIDVSGLISEFIRRHHYCESVSVLSNFCSIRNDDQMRLPLREEEYMIHPEYNGVIKGDPKQGKKICKDPLTSLRKGFRLSSVCWD